MAQKNQTNSVEVSGYLAADPKFTTLNNGKNACTFTVAVNNDYEKDGKKVEKDPSYFPVVTYGEIADNMKDAKKGMAYTAKGVLQQRNYEKDGKKVYVTEVLAFNAEPVEKSGLKQSAFVEIAGNLTADPEFTTLNNGKNACTFTVAVNNDYEKDGKKVEKDPSYFTVNTYGDVADNMKKEGAKKGSFYKMKGFLNQERWEKDGVNHSAIKIQAIETKNLSKKIEKKDPERDYGMCF